ncbi:MAG: 50S ribosomal protein L24, partial [Treponema sp.]|nr:50S ribosomal protein L24 [Treponema sp.]
MVEAAHKFKLKKEDTVQIIAGKDKGKRGRILKILRDKDRVVVEGLNIVKKTQKRRSQQDRGGIVEVEAAIHSSNVQ